MGEAAVITKYSVQEYLELEKNSQEKFEFHDGYVTAMAGGTPGHALISANVSAELRNLLRKKGRPCATYSSDAKIAIEQARRFYYPDASVVCGDTELSAFHPQAIINPILLVEVISESTESFDRGEKFFYYRQIPSLKEYLIVNQHRAIVEIYFREAENVWQFRTIVGLASSIPLQSLSGEIAMAEVYLNVKGLEAQS